MVKTKRLALWMGVIMGGIHLLWALCIWIIPTTFQNILNWIFDLHFMQLSLIITPFDFSKMLMLVVCTFIIGWIMGRITGRILNDVMKKK